MRSRHLALAIGMAFGVTAMANTVPFYENFDGDWRVNFPTRIDMDNNHPTAQMMTLFLDGDMGGASPWWPLKDSNTSDDRFMSSHSRYSPAGTSNDWLGSRPIEIPTEGFNLTFGAQSARYGSSQSLSTLWVYITETPVTNGNEPAEPTMVYENVPENDAFNVEKDFTQYTINLDAYAGKTIYLYFVNKNTEKDFLCIDEVKIERLDPTELESSTTPMIVKGDYVVNSKMTAVEPIGKWTLTFSDGINPDQKVEGEALAAGENLEHVWTASAPGNTVINYALTLDVEGMQPVVSKGTVDVLDFEPYHRVLIEESTGLWCGNCPMGMYNMEEIMKDEEMKEYSIPVSVHISGSGTDYLVNENYAAAFGVLAAPAYRLDRDPVVRYFSTTEDVNFNKDNEKSMAYAVTRRHRELTTMDINLEAEYHVVDGDTIQILATAKLRPAKDFNSHNMRLGFIVKENNVNADSPLMMQHNYFSGVKLAGNSTMGGWVNLPEVVSNFYFQDVARGIYNYRGMENSVPAEMKCGEEYNVAYAVPIPKTFYQESYGGQLCIGNPALQTDFVTLVAFLYDSETQRIVNAVAFPMSEIASHRVDMADLSGVDKIEADEISDSDAPVVWYDLQGRRVENPTSGMYIKVQGDKSEKVVLR